MPGCLYLVSLPIGHLGDMTHRAVEILRSADAIVAEDTRNTRKLLHHFDIQTPFFSSLYQGVESRRIEPILRALAEGKSLALVSDAGTPLISDPGFPLVRSAVEAGVRVVPIPGPTAAISALIASGLPTDRFVFEGSVPRKRQGRTELIGCLQTETRTVILYESPHRIEQTLKEFSEGLPDRAMVVARELTKIHEEFVRGTPSEILSSLQTRNAVRGEFVIVIRGCEPSSVAHDEDAMFQVVSRLIEEGVARRAIVDVLRTAFALSRNEAYALVQEAKRGFESPE